MKIFNLLNMGYLLSGLLTVACEDGMDSYNPTQKIVVEKIDSNEFVQAFSFKVMARSWRKVSITDRYIEAAIPEITNKIMTEGLVMVYLNEAGKTVSLPFTYYQIRHAMSFQPSYEEGSVYVNILGNFIFSSGTSYMFKVLIINAKGLKKYKSINWNNFEEVKPIFNRN